MLLVPSATPDIDSLWAAYKARYTKSYASELEEARRLHIFTVNMDQADMQPEDDLESVLTRFADRTDAEVSARLAQARVAQDEQPPVYDGPTVDSLANPVARVEFPNAGLVLEVADSLLAGAGRGLFVSLMDGFDSVILDASTVFCGYAVGEMKAGSEVADPGDTTVAFILRTPETAVFFEGEVWTVRELLAAEHGIAGHVAVRDSGALRVELERAYEGARFFVPRDTQPSPLTFEALGHLANDLAVDLAGGGDAAGYLERSQNTNLLVPMQRLERDPDAPGTLRPLPPVLTLSRAVTFANVAPRELGNEYGEPYWEAHYRSLIPGSVT